VKLLSNRTGIAEVRVQISLREAFFSSCFSRRENSILTAMIMSTLSFTPLWTPQWSGRYRLYHLPYSHHQSTSEKNYSKKTPLYHGQIIIDSNDSEAILLKIYILFKIMHYWNMLTHKKSHQVRHDISITYPRHMTYSHLLLRRIPESFSCDVSISECLIKNDGASIQSTLDSVSSWASMNLKKPNVKKCKECVCVCFF